MHNIAAHAPAYQKAGTERAFALYRDAGPLQLHDALLKSLRVQHFLARCFKEVAQTATCAGYAPKIMAEYFMLYQDAELTRFEEFAARALPPAAGPPSQHDLLEAIANYFIAGHMRHFRTDQLCRLEMTHTIGGLFHDIALLIDGVFTAPSRLAPGACWLDRLGHAGITAQVAALTAPELPRIYHGFCARLRAALPGNIA